MEWFGEKGEGIPWLRGKTGYWDLDGTFQLSWLLYPPRACETPVRLTSGLCTVERSAGLAGVQDPFRDC